MILMNPDAHLGVKNAVFFKWASFNHMNQILSFWFESPDELRKTFISIISMIIETTQVLHN